MSGPDRHFLLVACRSPHEVGRGDGVITRARIAMLRRHGRVSVLCYGAGGTPWPDPGVQLHEVAFSRPQAARGAWAGVVAGLPFQVGMWRQPAFVRAFRDLLAQGRFDGIGFVTLRAGFALRPEAAGWPGAPRWLEMIDLLSDNMRAIGARQGGLRGALRAFEATRLARLERAAPALFSPVFLVNPDEAARDAGFTHLPLSLGPAQFCPVRPDPAPGSALRICLSGNFHYLPNHEAAHFAWAAVQRFARETGRGAEFFLLGRGAGPLAARLGLGSGMLRAEEPADMAAALARCDVALCPVFTHTGVQNKLLEAAAAGLIVLATPGPAAVLGLEPGRHILAVTDVASAAAHLAAIAADPARFGPLRLAAQAHVRAHHSQDAVGAALAVHLGLPVTG